MDLIKELSQSLQNYNPGAYNWALSVVANTIMKTGLYLIGILFLYELSSIFERVNESNDGMLTFKMFQGSGLRLALSGALVTGSTFILQFILMIANGTVTLFGQNSGGTFNVLGNVIPSIILPQSIPSLLGDMFNLTTNIPNFISTALLYVIALFVQLIAYLVVWIVLISRAFEMFVLFILAPIPSASFASKEFSYIGKRYYQYFGALAFQNVVILVVMGLYSFFAKLAINMSLPQDGMMNAFSFAGAVQLLAGIVYAIVFIVALLGSQSKAKKLFGL